MNRLEGITVDTIINSLDHPFYIIDAEDNSVLLTNKKFDPEITGKKYKCHKLFHGNKTPCRDTLQECPVKLIKESGKPVTVEHIHLNKEGERRIVEIHAVPIFDEEGNIGRIIEYSRDITDLKRAEMVLKESEAKHRQLIENSNDGIYLIYKNRFEIINKKFEEMFKITQEKVHDPNFSFMELVSPKSHNLIKSRNRSFLKGKKLGAKYEYTALRTDGEELEVEVSVSYVKYKNGFAVQGIVRDISGRKNLEQRIFQLQKMKSLGELASGISHDFNNILSAIYGFAEISVNKVPENSSVRSNIEQIINAAERGKELIEQILFFSKKSENKFMKLNLELIISEGMKLIRPLIPSSIKINTNIITKNNYILGDRTQLYQILLNLCINAGQAMINKKGRIEISVVNKKIDNSDSKILLMKPGKYLELKVCDNGIGISEQNQKYIFDPFFTTRKREDGTGMGLSTVHSIVKSHNGMIFVKSKVGEGTTFSLYFPSVSIKVEKPVDKINIQEGGNEKILIVDDDKSITDIFKEMLIHFGYSVVISNNSKDAFDQFRKDKNYFDLILTDQTMPDISGIQLARKIRGFRKNIPIILCSGSDDSANIRIKDKKFITRSITKPVSMNFLSQVVRESLDQ